MVTDANVYDAPAPSAGATEYVVLPIKETSRENYESRFLQLGTRLPSVATAGCLDLPAKIRLRCPFRETLGGAGSHCSCCVRLLFCEYVGVVNMNVVQLVCRVVAGSISSRLVELVADGDLLATVASVFQRGVVWLETKGHATDLVVQDVQCRTSGESACKQAEIPAGFCRRRQFSAIPVHSVLI